MCGTHCVLTSRKNMHFSNFKWSSERQDKTCFHIFHIFTFFFLHFLFWFSRPQNANREMSRNSKAPKLAVKGHFIDLPTVVHERNSLDNTRPLWTPGAFSQFPWNRRFVADQEYLMRRGIQDWKCDI